MTGVTVGAPYSQAAKTAALSAIGGDAFPQTLPELLQQVVIASNANGITGYVPSYATQAEADAVANCQAANDVVYLEGSGGPIGGPGSCIKTITLVPTSSSIGGDVTLTIGGVSMVIWSTSTYAEAPPPVNLVIGATNTGSSNCSMGLVSTNVKAIVTGYLTPTV